MGVLKPGAEFVSDETGRSVAFPFAHSLDRARHARLPGAPLRVRRRALRQCAAQRARARWSACASPMSPSRRAAAPASTARGRGRRTSRSFAPRFVLDASGRDTFMAGRLRTKRANKHNNTAAVFAHFRGVAARSGETAGYISIHLAEDGWFWMIPLPGEVMSVGFVGNQAAFKARGTARRRMFSASACRSSPTVRARMVGAERVSEVHSAGNYSYRADAAWGEGWMMIGDAFAFIDPVFSSGVLLAMTAGERGADVACAWLDEPASRARGGAARRGRAARDDGRHLLADLPHQRSGDALDVHVAAQHGCGCATASSRCSPAISRSDWRSRLPILALKGTFHLLSLAHRLGWRLEHPADSPDPTQREQAWHQTRTF